MRKLAIITMAAAVSACSAGSGATYAPSSASARPAPPRADTFKPPSIDRAAGVDGIIGTGAPSLLRRLGNARIDLTEGDSRKLQFAGASCVLDIYLYPLQAGAEPVATHIEARLRQGGAAADKSQCLSEVETR
uniref:hypothetical protein n=1 Tax=uncultured Erythrobacter sp. TaxID=263913 RepID=UPI002631F126|nr:hypothetical protein [uncultured Erythrobacter sp.]